jgi:hypothetical protein
MHAEATTTEQQTVPKTVSGKGLAVRIDGRFRNFSGLWRGRRKLGSAPADLPAPAIVQITATSAADSASSASAHLTVTSDIILGISSASTSVELGAKQTFAATLTTTGQPKTTVR